MWYDIFSLFYDRTLEHLYAPYRPAAIDSLRLAIGQSVLDVPCGTGQSFPLLARAVGGEGLIEGLDRSSGMMHKARQRAAKAGWRNVRLHLTDLSTIDAAQVADLTGRAAFDGVLCALGLTAFESWEAAFEVLFALVRPGGRFVLFDVYAPHRTAESRSVEWVARADLSRRAWQPLQSRCSDFDRVVLEADARKFGGELYVASGTRPIR